MDRVKAPMSMTLRPLPVPTGRPKSSHPAIAPCHAPSVYDTVLALCPTLFREQTCSVHQLRPGEWVYPLHVEGMLRSLSLREDNSFCSEDGSIALSLRLYRTAPPHHYECIPPTTWSDIRIDPEFTGPRRRDALFGSRGSVARNVSVAYNIEDEFPHVPPHARHGRFVGQLHLYNPFLHVTGPRDTAVPPTLRVCVEEWPTVGMLEGMEERYASFFGKRIEEL